MEAREARFFARLSLLCSRCSLIRSARSFWYSAASVLAFATLCFLIATLWRFLCKVRGVTNLWILGALLLFLPVAETNVRRYVFTYFLTSSSLVRLKSLRILVALLGPLILGFSVSVRPGRSLSPCLTMTRFNTDKSGLTIHPLTDLRLRSPLRLPCPRKHEAPLCIRRRTRP